MADEVQETTEEEVTRVVEVESQTVTTVEPAIDWDAAPAVEPAVVDTPPVTQVVTTRTPRGKWDFTNPQRIMLAVLIWLNILMFAVGYLAVTGRLGI